MRSMESNPQDTLWQHGVNLPPISSEANSTSSLQALRQSSGQANSLSSLGGEGRISGGPRFEESKKFGGNENFPGDISEAIAAAKSNGWGMHLHSWLAESKQFTLFVTFGLVLAALFFSVQMQPALYTAMRTFVANLGSQTVSHIQIKEGSLAESLPLERSIPLESINITLSPDGTVVETSSHPSIALREDSIATPEAQGGEGITHLARRAISERLLQQSASLSPEQRIYAEDYVQNAIGDYSLNQGDKLSFGYDLLDDAIASSQKLSDVQLQNLTKYSSHVAAFN